jgi:carbamoyltransferase
VSEYFELDAESPYMLLVAPVREERRIAMTAEQKQLFGIDKLNVPRSDVPAITHVDYSARVQTVSRERKPALLRPDLSLRALTGCPVIVNTSSTSAASRSSARPEDAYRCFMRTDMDVVARPHDLRLGRGRPGGRPLPRWHRSSAAAWGPCTAPGCAWRSPSRR